MIRLSTMTEEPMINDRWQCSCVVNVEIGKRLRWWNDACPHYCYPSTNNRWAMHFDVFWFFLMIRKECGEPMVGRSLTDTRMLLADFGCGVLPFKQSKRKKEITDTNSRRRDTYEWNLTELSCLNGTLITELKTRNIIIVKMAGTSRLQLLYKL